MTVKETLCTGCMHAHVCSLKQTFLEAQKAIDNLSISTDEHEQRLIDISWLRTELHCSHFKHSVFYRDTDTDNFNWEDKL